MTKKLPVLIRQRNIHSVDNMMIQEKKMNEYRRLPEFRSADITDSSEQDRTSEFPAGVLRDADGTAAAVILLEMMLMQARKAGATDIHIESGRVRFRISGRLTDHMILHRRRTDELVRRIKLLSRMNVLEKRRSQDGQFVYGAGNPLYVRVSCLCTADTGGEGESIVMRLLDPERIPLTLASLGLSDAQQNTLLKVCTEQSGLALVCGAAGAGKSTTAAAMICAIRDISGGSRKIISIEDPPEYVLSGVTQIHTDRAADVPEALRRAFSQDPDVIMIGEIRDEETAVTAVRAALTGHFVIATVQASDVASAVLHMIHLGADPDLLASALRCVMIQQLIFRTDDVRLIADAAVPDTRKLRKCMTGTYTDEDTESCFFHCTNILTEAVRPFKRLSFSGGRNSVCDTVRKCI